MKSRPAAIRMLPLFVVMLVVTSLVAGCSNQPGRIKPPNINASSAARAALEQYDTNGDSFLAGEELKEAPALRTALKTIDSDGDSQISEEELAARIQAWADSRSAALPITCRVLLNGKPAADVEVLFEPEPFLGEEILSATGISNVFGDAAVAVSEAERPAEGFPSGVQLGFYRVRFRSIPGGKTRVPSRYEEQALIGQEVSYEDPAVANNQVVFSLTSR